MDSEKSKIVFAPSKLGWVVIIVVVLAIAAIPSYYFYTRYQKTQALLQNPSASVDAQSKEVAAAVEKLMELPTNETPTVATVSDITKLSDQPFFAKAQNGDKVLIYSNAKKAILYRPSINKIIEVAPVNLGLNNLAPSPAVKVQSPNPSVGPIGTSIPTFVPAPTTTP